VRQQIKSSKRLLTSTHKNKTLQTPFYAMISNVLSSLRCAPAYFVITINRRSTIINTTITVKLQFSRAFLEKRSSRPFARRNCAVCLSTPSSTSSSNMTCPSSSSPICMLNSLCRPILAPSTSSWSSWSRMTWLWYSWICWLSRPEWSGAASGSGSSR
jgi:hypothetical protein